MDIEDLENIFSIHATTHEKERKEWVEKWRKDYPNDPIPDHCQDDFNIAFAFSCICREIIKIKKVIDGMDQR